MQDRNPQKIVPKNWKILRVIIIARISTEHQDILSLADQIAKCQEYLKTIWDGKVEFKIIESRGSGEFLDRQELLELEELIESGEFDLVIAEDLGRICRRRRAYDICEMCVDSDTRLIAIGDRVDTAVDGWEDSAFISTWHHERSNRDTANRIKRSLNNRFDNGGVVQFTIYGYLKPPGTKNDSQLQKDPAAEPIVKEIFRRLEDGASYAEIGDWLNSCGIPMGPYCRQSKWDHKSVSRFVHQTILKGIRVRNQKVSKRNNKTGRRRSVDGDPSELRIRNCPHLAFVDPEYYDRVIQAADQRNSPYRRTNKGNRDPRLGVSRKRTEFPGQHARCGVCGRLMHWSGSRVGKVMVCSGATSYRCWNSLYVNGARCAERVVSAVLNAIMEMPEFDEVFGELVRHRADELKGQFENRRRKIDANLADVNRRLANVLKTLEERPDSEGLLTRMDELEQQKAALQFELKQLDQEPEMTIALPAAMELRRQSVMALQQMSADDPEVGRLLRRLIPELLIVPYAVCDDSDIVARAEVTVSLASLIPPGLSDQQEDAVYTRRLVIDIEAPSQRVEHHAAAAKLQAEGMFQRDIGKRLGIYQSAVQAALRVAAIMESRRLTDPYVRLVSLPSMTHKLKRHRHPRFEFEPLDGFPKFYDQ